MNFVLNIVNIVAVVCAVMALIGVVITAIASLLISRRSAYLSAVTIERSKWIDKLRVNISRLISLVHTLDTKLYADDEFSGSEDYTQMSAEIVKLMVLVQLQLNPDGKIDSNILALLTAMQNYVGEQDYKNLERVFVRHIQWLLKEEWEKVKYEARGPVGRLWAFYKRWRRAVAYKKFCAGAGNISVWNSG